LELAALFLCCVWTEAESFVILKGLQALRSSRRAAGQVISPWTFSQDSVSVPICFQIDIYVSRVYASRNVSVFHHTRTEQWGICECVLFDDFYEQIDL